MIIENLSENNIYINLFKVDENGREINLYKLSDSKVVGENLFYPNCLIYSNSRLYNPINERIMSLGDVCKSKEYNITNTEYENVEECDVFYFIYNTDNYYHFIYDTLPYLITYDKIREDNNNIKLLMNYPNPNKSEFYKFVLEFLEILNIKENDILIVDSNTLYKNIYISSSYTHGIDSNLPPRNEIYELYNKIVESVKNIKVDITYPKKIYVSRRTWTHNDLSNIGTNYTTRRRLENEDALVSILVDKGYEEVFTERLSTIDKILMFSNAEVVIGAIGGGLCNVLFSNRDTKLIVLVSPTFLDVNTRFKYSFSNVDTIYFENTVHVEKGYWKKYMRVNSNRYNIIGEVEEVKNETLVVSYTSDKVSGWNSNMNLNKRELPKNDCIALDKGLNSLWFIDLKKLSKYI